MAPRCNHRAESEVPSSVRMPGQNEHKSVTDTARELWDLLQAYAKQETVDPLKNLGRYLGYGIGGMLLVGFGLALMALGLLRLLQTPDVFEDTWSWAPYAIVAAVLGLFIGLLGRSIARYRGVPDHDAARHGAPVDTAGARR
jgi:hypothetical protein